MTVSNETILEMFECEIARVNAALNQARAIVHSLESCEADLILLRRAFEVHTDRRINGAQK